MIKMIKNLFKKKRNEIGLQYLNRAAAYFAASNRILETDHDMSMRFIDKGFKNLKAAIILLRDNPATLEFGRKLEDLVSEYR